MIKEWWEKFLFKRKLHRMDEMARTFACYNCFDPFPPSFYYTHTEEEIRKVKKELRESLMEIWDSYTENTEENV